MSRWLVVAAVVGCGAPPPLEDSPCVKCDPNAETTPVGTWHVQTNDGHVPLDLLGLPRIDALRTIAIAQRDDGSFDGTITDRTGTRALVVAWEAAEARLELADAGAGEWFDVHVVDGILVGRSASAPERPTDYRRFVHHVTGWNETQLDRDIAPRTFDLLVNEQARAVLRIDHAPAGSPRPFVGRYKVYATIAENAGVPGTLGHTGEQLEDDVAIDAWDGHHVQFTRTIPVGTAVFTGDVDGLRIAGTVTTVNGTFAWAGRRSQVLGFGLTPRATADRDAWVARTRRQLQTLVQAGAPAPLDVTVHVLRERAPFERAGDWPPDRDDDPEHVPAAYRLAELEILQTLPNPYDAARPLVRRSHAWLATPTAPPPPGTKYPGAVVLDGHSGSARRLVQPDASDDSFGEWFARRNYVMIAVDVSHRPVEDRHGLYPFFEDGDDPVDGNGAHPAIRADGLDTDWVEDGERAYDASRALDVLLAQPNIDPDRVVVTGLSMGGEVTLIAGALDPRFAMAIPSGMTLDASVDAFHVDPDEPHVCWTWDWAGMRDYIDFSDYVALTAPRPLVLGTGQHDIVYSALAGGPYASVKQGVRRARAAYGDDAARFVHDLHGLGHEYHAGSINPNDPARPQGLRIPAREAPDATGSTAWQTDAATRPGDANLFAAIDRLLGR